MLYSTPARLTLFLSLLFALTAFAEPGSPSDRTYQPPPVFFYNTRAENTEQQRAQWRKTFFEGPELWFFRNRKDFDALIENSGLDADSQTALKAGFRTRLTDEEFPRAIDYYPRPPEAEGLLLVPEEIRKKMPRDFFQRIYDYQQKLTGREKNTIGDVTERDLIHHLTGLTPAGYSDPRVVEIRRNLFFRDREWKFPILPATWNLLSLRARDVFIDSTLGQAMAGIDPFIKISPQDDMDAIARFFAGERAPGALIRYLRYRRARQPTGELVVRLDTVLHAFIRKNVNTFSDCHGPNCLNAARNVSLGNRNVFEMIQSGEEFEKDLKTRMRPLENGDRYRPGDVIVYRNAEGRIVHAAVLAADGIVFTKNGVTRNQPYIFQDRAAMEKGYFPDGKFSFSVYKGLDPVEMKKVQRLRNCNYEYLNARRHETLATRNARR